MSNTTNFLRKIYGAPECRTPALSPSKAETVKRRSNSARFATRVTLGATLGLAGGMTPLVGPAVFQSFVGRELHLHTTFKPDTDPLHPGRVIMILDNTTPEALRHIVDKDVIRQTGSGGTCPGYTEVRRTIEEEPGGTLLHIQIYLDPPKGISR